MSKKRRNHSSAFKAKVALAALKGDKTMSELSSFYALNPAQIQKWKKQLLEGSKDVFGASEKERKHYESEVKELCLATIIISPRIASRKITPN